MYAHMFYHAHTYYVLTINLDVSCEPPGRYLLVYPRGYTHPFPARYHSTKPGTFYARLSR